MLAVAAESRGYFIKQLGTPPVGRRAEITRTVGIAWPRIDNAIFARTFAQYNRTMLCAS